MATSLWFLRTTIKFWKFHKSAPLLNYIAYLNMHVNFVYTCIHMWFILPRRYPTNLEGHRNGDSCFSNRAKLNLKFGELEILYLRYQYKIKLYENINFSLYAFFICQRIRTLLIFFRNFYINYCKNCSQWWWSSWWVQKKSIFEK